MGGVPSTSSETVTPRRRGIRRLLSVRTINVALLVVLLSLISVVGLGKPYRRFCFWCTGNVKIDGLTFYLQPDDTYLTQWVVNLGYYEPEETELFRRKIRPGDTVIDVGANIGWYTVIASKLVGSQGRVIAFEPDPTSFEFLKRNVEVNGCDNVILEQKALSNEKGTVKLFIAEHHKGRHRIFDWGDGRKYVEVEAFPLDDYLDDFHGGVDVVKVDTEGAEGVILEGMEETLRRNRDVKVFLEYAPCNLSRAGYDPRELLNRFKALGFEFYGISEAGNGFVSMGDEEGVSRAQAADPSILNLYLERPVRGADAGGARQRGEGSTTDNAAL